MVKEFKFNYLGQETTITVEDKAKAGVILPIVKRSMKFMVGQQMPTLDTEEYLIGLATNVIIKAPWPLQNVDVLKNMTAEEFVELGSILGDIYPMERFLFLSGKMLYGKKCTMPESISQTESTISSPSGESLNFK